MSFNLLTSDNTTTGVDYVLHMDHIQPDFNRYVSLSRSFDINKLSLCCEFCKLKLKDYLKLSTAFHKNIIIRLISSDEYTYDVVFNFAEQDVFLRLEHRDLSGHVYTANVMLHQNNAITTDLTFVNNEVFISDVVIPTKLIFVMFYQRIITLINTCWSEVMSADTFITTTYNNIMESLKQNQTNNPVNNNVLHDTEQETQEAIKNTVADTDITAN